MSDSAITSTLQATCKETSAFGDQPMDTNLFYLDGFDIKDLLLAMDNVKSSLATMGISLTNCSKCS